MAMSNRSFKKRIYTATFFEHDGTRDNADGTGMPDYADANWDQLSFVWPCEVLTVNAGETIRGKQVTAQTTHVIYGEHAGAIGVTSTMRCRLAGGGRGAGGAGQYEGTDFAIVGISDETGLAGERRIELRSEQ